MITSVNSTEHLNGSLFPFSFCAQGRISWPVVIRQNWAPQGLKWLLAQFMHVIGQRVQLPTPKVVSSLRKQPTSWSLALNCLSHSLFSGLSLDEIYTINLPIVFNVYFSLHASSLSDTSPPPFWTYEGYTQCVWIAETFWKPVSFLLLGQYKECRSETQPSFLMKASLMSQHSGLSLMTYNDGSKDLSGAFLEGFILNIRFYHTSNIHWIPLASFETFRVFQIHPFNVKQKCK